MGTILSQEGESDVLHVKTHVETPHTPHKKLKLHPVAYYSATFTETE